MNIIYLEQIKREFQDMRLEATEKLSKQFYFWPVGTLVSDINNWLQATESGSNVFNDKGVDK